MIAKKFVSLILSAMFLIIPATMPVMAVAEETSETNDIVYKLKDGVNNDFDKYEKLSFLELLSMSDEDYINLVFNGYRGNDENASKCYNFIDPVIRSNSLIYTGKTIENAPSNMQKTEWPLYQNELYVYSGISDEDQNLLNEEVNNMFGENIFGSMGDVKGICKYEESTYAVMNYISSSFSISLDYEETLDYFNQDAMFRELDKYFGDELDYKVYLNNGKNNYKIIFDVDDLKKSKPEYLGLALYDPSLENILYMSKILYVLNSICPTASSNNPFAKGVSDNGELVYENIVQQEETTTTTITTTISETETSFESAESSVSSVSSVTESVSKPTTTTTIIKNIDSPKTGVNNINKFLLLIAGASSMTLLFHKKHKN